MRYFIDLSYNGKYYHGWQNQPNAISIQEVLENALSRLLRTKIAVVGAGRTDAGVHAKQLFAHFDINTPFDTDNLTKRLNAFLPDDIKITKIINVNNDAHARFNAITRSYEYQIWLGKNPFLINSTWQIHNKKLNIEAMNLAASTLLNYTNFKCFAKSKTDVYTYDCDITEAKWLVDGNLLTFHITANRFLRNMVRSIVGTLYDIGIGKISLSDFNVIIKSQDRTKAGISVPAKGLFLTKIVYPNSIYK
ncbi:MAG: tRNA pseudouridine(38-40) synthase TruA [Flavobacteriaceae bacterium]